MSEIKNTTNFELVSPEEKLVSKPAHMIVVPGDDGDFAAMSGSASLLSSLRSGVVQIFWETKSDDPQQIFITGGFADVNGDQCTILAEDAQDVADFDQSDIEQTIKNLQEDLDYAKDDQEKKKIKDKLALANARLEAVTGKLQRVNS